MARPLNRFRSTVDSTLSAAMRQSRRSSIVIRSDSMSCAPVMVEVKRVPFTLELMRSGAGAALLSAFSEASIDLAADAPA